MVFAQERYHVFRIGTFSEPCETAQVAEECGYLPAMAL
jgi:hypothetical protein